MATTHILAIGKIVSGEIEMDISMLPLPEVADGELQRLIDEGEMTQELIDDMEDRAFWAGGGW